MKIAATFIPNTRTLENTTNVKNNKIRNEEYTLGKIFVKRGAKLANQSNK